MKMSEMKRLPVLEVFFEGGVKKVKFSRYLQGKIYGNDKQLCGVVLGDENVLQFVIFGEEMDAVIGYCRTGDMAPFVRFEKHNFV